MIRKYILLNLFYSEFLQNLLPYLIYALHLLKKLSMPVIKRLGINYLEDFEEVDEHAPFFAPNYLEEEEASLEEKTTSPISIWKKYWVRFKSIFAKG